MTEPTKEYTVGKARILRVARFERDKYFRISDCFGNSVHVSRDEAKDMIALFEAWGLT